MVGDVADGSQLDSKDLEDLDTGEMMRVRDFKPGREPGGVVRLAAVATDGLQSMVDDGELVRMGKGTEGGGTWTRRFSTFRVLGRISMARRDCASPSCPKGRSMFAKTMLPELSETRRPIGTRFPMDCSPIIAKVCGDDGTWSTGVFRVAGLLGGEYDRECDELAEVVEEESDGVSESLVLTPALECLRRTRRGK